MAEVQTALLIVSHPQFPPMSDVGRENPARAGGLNLICSCKALGVSFLLIPVEHDSDPHAMAVTIPICRSHMRTLTHLADLNSYEPF